MASKNIAAIMISLPTTRSIGCDLWFLQSSLLHSWMDHWLQHGHCLVKMRSQGQGYFLMPFWLSWRCAFTQELKIHNFRINFCELIFYKEIHKNSLEASAFSIFHNARIEDYWTSSSSLYVNKIWAKSGMMEFWVKLLWFWMTIW